MLRSAIYASSIGVWMEIFDIMITQFTLNLFYIFSVKQIINTGLYVGPMQYNRNRPWVKSEKYRMCYQLLFGSATACQLCRWPFRNFPLRVPSFVLVADGAWFLQLEAKAKYYVFITAQTIFIFVLTTSRSTKWIASLINNLLVSLTINETFPKHPNSVFVLALFYIEHK